MAIPGKIQSINEAGAVVDFCGLQSQTGLQLVPAARVGDYVLVHAGFAIQVLDSKEAEERLALFREMEGRE